MTTVEERVGFCAASPLEAVCRGAFEYSCVHARHVLRAVFALVRLPADPVHPSDVHSGEWGTAGQPVFSCDVGSRGLAVALAPDILGDI